MVDLEKDDEDALVEECSICGGDIYIDSDCEEEDIVYCNDCEAEFLVHSLDPLRLTLLDDDLDDEGDSEEDDFDEDYD
ncbi:MAG: hypothetical protein ACOX4Z_06735 [Desulfobulbus sp.]|jgi:alpha-aminoadipate carrier protein LysW|nr:hypothetical protein [Desulfobulbaceae bacterium]